MRRLRVVWVWLALVAVSACSIRDAACGPPRPEQTAQQQASPSPSPDASGTGRSGGSTSSAFEIVLLGDSLTAGYGLLSDQAYPQLIENKFHAEGYADVDVINAGISGDTTAGGVRRVETALTPSTRILVVALGGNDALRGLTTTETRENLVRIIDTARAKRIAVLLCGMEAPTNLGEDYRERFRDIFLQLARQYKGEVAIMPFLLEGVAGVPALNQPDGIHPNVEGAKAVADQVYGRLRTMRDSMG